MFEPPHARYALIASVALLIAALSLKPASVSGQAPASDDATTLRVPQDHSTIQAAIDAASDGMRVLVSAGTYHEELRIAGKRITLASRFVETFDPQDVERTVLDGEIPRSLLGARRAEAVIDVLADAGPGTGIIGFTIQGGDDGIRCEAEIEILHNRFVRNTDAIDYEDGGGGSCRYNLFENNRDDGVDLDDACAVRIEENLIRNNDDDGIEIRLHPYSGPRLEIVIRDNRILGNREDGIQIIDYPGLSDRHIRIERNLIADTAMAAIGFMADANTREDYSAADVPEPVEIVNNTLVNNHYGITGGDSVVAINNIIAGTERTALKRVDGDSILAHNLLWNNGSDNDGSNVELRTTRYQSPVLDDDYRPAAGSPVIDAGVSEFRRRGEALIAIPRRTYSGAAPDLGAFEVTD
jgi:hypothetical protein